MQKIRFIKLFVVPFGAAVALSACTSTSEPQPTLRTATQTAPADLQLLCAAQGAERFGVSRDKALPLSSGPETANSYRVVLNLDGSTATCIIDETGFIQSLEMA